MRFYRKIKNCTADYGCTVFVLYTMFARPNIIRIVHFSRMGLLILPDKALNEHNNNQHGECVFKVRLQHS